MSVGQKTSHAFSFLMSTNAKFINKFKKMPSYFTTYHKISLHLSNIYTLNNCKYAEPAFGGGERGDRPRPRV
jgi:hypothetical protein